MPYYNPAYPYGNPYGQQPAQGYQPYVQQPVMPPQQPSIMNNGWGQPQQSVQPQTQTFKTNKIFVENLDDAMSRQADPNSQMIYIDKYKPYIYDIYTDNQLNKHPNTIPIGDVESAGAAQTAKNDKVEYVTRQEFEAIQGQMAAFSDRLDSLARKGAKKNEPIE